ncbi:hypothetical protein QR98_0045990 [Sarcoptes scabiei]|uniref:Regulator of microtubule dynamics protein 1 n=1 Tax=Sarcoptes scabiei TaxID=52283 RepID=A0A132A576_SARSC|nr:hypothetical protein QR98_0045990 [Sarcoptes scabiei]
MENPNDADLFWRMAKVTHLLSKKFDKFLDLNGERRKSLLFKSYNYASEALKLDEKNFNCHKWYFTFSFISITIQSIYLRFAISIGCISEFVSLKDKISNALKFHHHLEKALVMNKNDPILHYLFGRFCLEILSVSWAERRIVKTFFGGTLPSVSYELALDYFERAYDLKPKWKENLIFLCKTLLQIKQNHRAKQYFEEANSIPDDEIDDETIKDEFKSLKNLLEK